VKHRPVRTSKDFYPERDGGDCTWPAARTPERARQPASGRCQPRRPAQSRLTKLDSWQQAEQGGEVRFGDSLLCGPAERDPGSATYRIQVRLARGALRPLLRMRIDIDRRSSSSTALELIPTGRVRPTAAYFRAGHLLLDSLTRHLLQPSPPAQVRDTASRPPAPVGAGRP
jgi:hypothetical protein